MLLINYQAYLLVLLSLLLVSTHSVRSYVSSFVLNQSTFKPILTFEYPHVDDPVLVCSIRDISSTDNFSWEMKQSLEITNTSMDRVSFDFANTYWPTGKLQQIVIDYYIFSNSSKQNSIEVFKLRVVSHQTHVQRPNMNVRDPKQLMLFPTGFTNIQYTSKFNYMIVKSEYKLYAVHYEGEGHDSFKAGNWVEFYCVLIDTFPYPDFPDIKKLQIGRVQNGQYVLTKVLPDKFSYFMGIKGVYSYKSQGQFVQDEVHVGFRDMNSSGFGIYLFPIPKTGLLDTRAYHLEPVVVCQENRTPKQVIAVFASLGCVVLLLFYVNYKARIARKHQNIQKFTEESSSTQHQFKTCQMCGTVFHATTLEANKKAICPECR